MLLSSKAIADTLAKTFGSNKTISPGYVVALDTTNSQNVVLAPHTDVNRIYGVVVTPSDAAVTLQTSSDKVVVVTSGNYPVLVNMNHGAISKGDYLSLSSTDGIAAKATETQSYVLGRALQAFNGTSGVISGTGSNAAGLINVQIDPTDSPVAKGSPSVPGPLLRIANALAGRPVSATRVYTALAVFLVTFSVAASLIWVGIRSSMISIGRNPLSKHSILQGLFQVSISAAAIFAGGLVGVYLLLRL